LVTVSIPDSIARLAVAAVAAARAASDAECRALAAVGPWKAATLQGPPAQARGI